MIDLEPKYLDEVRRILTERAPECAAYAFGSRVTGKSARFADLDIVLVGETRMDWRTIARIKDAFSESDLPIAVDVVDWHALPEGFRDDIESHRELICSPVNV